MSLFGFFKKKQNIITEDDKMKLKEIQRKSYMEEAEALVVKRGKYLAEKDFGIKEPKKDWEI